MALGSHLFPWRRGGNGRQALDKGHCVGPPGSVRYRIPYNKPSFELDYDYDTYGWDIVYDVPIPAPGLFRLAPKQ